MYYIIMIPNLIFQETYIYASAFGGLMSSPEGSPTVVAYNQQFKCRLYNTK